jgi:hypothetical protein
MKSQNIFKKRQTHTHTETFNLFKNIHKGTNFQSLLALNVKDHGFNLGPNKIAFNIGICGFTINL